MLYHLVLDIYFMWENYFIVLRWLDSNVDLPSNTSGNNKEVVFGYLIIQFIGTVSDLNSLDNVFSHSLLN